MNNQEQLVKGIEKCQREKGLSDVALAEVIGVHSAMVHDIKFGKRQPGAKLLKGLAKNFPELHGLILNYLSDGGKPSLLGRIKGHFRW